MRLIARGGAWALAMAILLAFAFASTTPPGAITVVWAIAVTSAFTLALLPLTLALAGAAVWFSRRAADDARRHQVDGFVLAGLVCATYFARLEAAHQLVGPTSHTSLIGAVDLVLLALAGLVILRTMARVTPGTRGRAAVVVALTVLALQGLAWWQDPATDRTAAAAAFPATSPSLPVATASSARVLFIGIDGLDWQVLREAVAVESLPTIEGLIGRGRRWALATSGLKRSPESWSTIHTGTAPDVHGVGGFADWWLWGGTAVIRTRPYFGPHLPLFLDHLLARLPAVVCDFRLSTAEGVTAPAFWEVAADAGIRVAVVSPYPFTSPLLAVEGTMAVRDVQAGLWHVSRTTAGAATIDSIPEADLGPTVDDEVEDSDITVFHQQRVAMAERMFRTDAPQLGVFYTSFLDEILHTHWRAHCGPFGTCAQALGTHGGEAIRSALRLIDRDLARVIAAFGSPATIVLVSDHGWQLDGVEHVFGPDGVLVITPGDEPGVAQRSNVYHVAPTILALLGLPAEAGMTPVTAAGLTMPTRAPRRLSQTQLRKAAQPSTDRLNLLKSLGYLAR